MNSILDGKYDYNSNFITYSEEVKDLIEKLLKVDPTERISAQEAFNHKWI